MSRSADGKSGHAMLIGLMNLVPAPVARRFQSGGLLASLLRPVVNRLLPAEPQWVSLRSGPVRGARLLLHPRSEKFLWTGVHELEVQRVLVELLRPGMTFWDIGAHAGYFTILASRLVGSTGAVVAFEPHPVTRRRLEAAVAANECSNVTVLPFAIGAERATCRLHDGYASATNSLVGDGSSGGVDVECRRLQDVASPPPALLKLDVEGVEIEVLRAGSDWLTKTCPRIIAEFSSQDDMVMATSSLPGFKAAPIDARHWLVERRE